MKLSVITSLFNCLEYTQVYLKGLEKSLGQLKDLEYEIILIDDCSTDGTRDFLKTLSEPHYIIHENNKNSGFAKNNNRGANLANYDTLLFLNNDLEFSNPDWLSNMLEVFSKHKDCGALGNIQINPKTELIDHAGIFFDLLGRPAHARKNRKRPPQKDVSKWNAVTAACLMISKENFLSVEGFCEDYRNGCEDVDLCVKLRQKGLQNFIANKSIILHHVSTSPGRHDFNAKNTEIFLGKWAAVTRVWGQS